MTREKIIPLLSTWDEQRENRYPIPYIYSIQSNVQEFVYFGSRHSYDPKDAMFETLRKEWNEFYDRNKDREMVVLVEGGVRAVKASEEEAVLKGGEMAFITFLAHERTVPTDSFDLVKADIFDELAKKYDAEKVFYERMAQVVLQWNTLVEKPAFDNYMKYYMDKEGQESAQTDFDFSLDNFKKIHTELFNREFDETDRTFFYNIIDPAQKNTIMNQISRDEDALRDTAMVQGIVGEWQKGKSIFAVCGSGHVVIQERALKALLK